MSPLWFLKASKRILTKSICIIMDALRMQNPVEICHSPVWECCGYVVVSSTTWLQRDTRLLQSHISAWAVADNGDVLSVLSCFAVDSNTDSFIQLKLRIQPGTSLCFYTSTICQPQIKDKVVNVCSCVIILLLQSIRPRGDSKEVSAALVYSF